MISFVSLLVESVSISRSSTTNDVNPGFDLERYAAMLRDAEHLRGVSLGRDAWRRLKKRRPAVLSLAFLIGLLLLATFTPLLPFQPPRTVNMQANFHPPELQGMIESASLPAVLPAIESAQLYATDSDGESIAKTRADVSPEYAALDAGYGYESLDAFSKTLLETRIAWFGRDSFGSWFGTDNLGRDLLSRVFWGARMSLATALTATFVSLSIGVIYGSVAGYFGGWLDNAMMRLVDILYSIPFVFIVIFTMTVLDNEEYRKPLEDVGIGRMTIFFAMIGALFWLTMARVVRGQVISLKHYQFVEAAKSLGAGPTRIIRRHLIPNLLSIVIVYLTLTIPNVMLVEAFLSFLGLGVRSPDVSWGVLANEGVKYITPVAIYWWMVVFPGGAIALTLYSLNFLGDGLRDALDPRLKNR